MILIICFIVADYHQSQWSSSSDDHEVCHSNSPIAVEVEVDQHWPTFPTQDGTKKSIGKMNKIINTMKGHDERKNVKQFKYKSKG